MILLNDHAHSLPAVAALSDILFVPFSLASDLNSGDLKNQEKISQFCTAKQLAQVLCEKIIQIDILFLELNSPLFFFI